MACFSFLQYLGSCHQIISAVQLLQEYLATRGLDTPVEVETCTLEEVDEVVELLDSTNPPRISRVMLDNMAQPRRSSGALFQSGSGVENGVAVMTPRSAVSTSQAFS